MAHSAGGLAHHWVYEYLPETSYRSANVRAFYLLENVKSDSLPETYARLVQYADCLIDTTTSIYLEGASSTGHYYVEPETLGSDKHNEKKLDELRHQLVYGFCSQDQSPRIHAMNIATLSAETIHWDIFLRSHLNILNDRFIRNSDASYAYQYRQTYIRELEELDINVVDLLLGTALRLDNASDGHYYSSIGPIRPGHGRV